MGRLVSWIGAVSMNAVVYPATVIWTIVFTILFPVCYPVWKITTGRQEDRIARDFIWVYGRIWLLLISPFAPLRARGIDLRKWKGKPLILVSNHLCFFDPYFMAALPLADVVFTSRAWPFKMPWYGQFMRVAGYINMERLEWDGCLDESRRFFSQGAAVLFFPEGHRSTDGEIQRFYSGAFKIAMETGVPIVPLCISGAHKMLPPGRHYFLPARMSITALEPVYPRDFTGPLGHVELRKYVKKVMREHLLAEKE
jgi:1-acyl-sn-glycerol-3-phosphate acyltransferase